MRAVFQVKLMVNIVFSQQKSPTYTGEMELNS